MRPPLPMLALALLAVGADASAYPMPESSTARAARYDAWRGGIEAAERAAEQGEWAAASSGFATVVDDARAHSDRSLLLARALDGLGGARAHEMRLEEAAGLHEEAARLFTELLGDSQPRVAVTLSSLGAVYRELGRVADARAAFERAVSIFDRGPARDSARALDARRALAELASSDAQLEPALE